MLIKLNFPQGEEHTLWPPLLQRLPWRSSPSEEAVPSLQEKNEGLSVDQAFSVILVIITFDFIRGISEAAGAKFINLQYWLKLI